MSLDPFNDVEEDAWQQIQVLEQLELEEIINDLNEALKVSEADPVQFQLSTSDIQNRHQVLDKLQHKKNTLQSSWNQKANDPRRQREVTTMSNRISQDDTNPFSDQNRIDQEFNQFQQQEIIRDQDVQLDSIHETMRNLNQQAMIMGSELEDQGMMLDDLDQDLDRVDNRLQRGLKRVGWIIEKNGERGTDWCIGILMVALVILLILIIAV